MTARSHTRTRRKQRLRDRIRRRLAQQRRVVK